MTCGVFFFRWPVTKGWGKFNLCPICSSILSSLRPVLPLSCPPFVLSSSSQLHRLSDAIYQFTCWLFFTVLIFSLPCAYRGMSPPCWLAFLVCPDQSCARHLIGRWVPLSCWLPFCFPDFIRCHKCPWAFYVWETAKSDPDRFGHTRGAAAWCQKANNPSSSKLGQIRN